MLCGVLGIISASALGGLGILIAGYIPGWILMAILSAIHGATQRRIANADQYFFIGIVGLIISGIMAVGLTSDKGFIAGAVGELWLNFAIGGALILHAAAPEFLSAAGVALVRFLCLLKRCVNRSWAVLVRLIGPIFVLLLALAFLFPPADVKVIRPMADGSFRSSLRNEGFVFILEVGGDVSVRYVQWIVELLFFGTLAAIAIFRRRG